MRSTRPSGPITSSTPASRMSRPSSRYLAAHPPPAPAVGQGRAWVHQPDPAFRDGWGHLQLAVSHPAQLPGASSALGIAQDQSWQLDLVCRAEPSGGVDISRVSFLHCHCLFNGTLPQTALMKVTTPPLNSILLPLSVCLAVCVSPNRDPLSLTGYLWGNSGFVCASPARLTGAGHPQGPAGQPGGRAINVFPRQSGLLCTEVSVGGSPYVCPAVRS